MKIKLYTYADRRPDFIELQYRSLKHYLKNDFELIVFNNCSIFHPFRRQEIRNECKRLSLQCLEVKQNHSNPNMACAVPIQWSFDTIIKYDKGISCIIDSDMFLVSPFDIEKHMKNFDFAAVKQIREHVNYLWNGLMFFDLRTLPDKDSMNFMCGKVEGQAVDVGGLLYYWLKKNPDLRLRNILHTSHIYSTNQNMDCLPKEIREKYEEDFRFEIYDRAFLHYGRGSNWDKMDKGYHDRKTKLLHFFVEESITGKVKLPHYSYVFDEDAWKKKPQ